MKKLLLTLLASAALLRCAPALTTVSDMTSIGGDADTADLLYIINSQSTGAAKDRKMTLAQLVTFLEAQGLGGGAWGSITGTLSAQSDLSAALGLKAPLASPTFTGTVTIPGGASITGYLTTAAAASAYQPLDADLTTFATITPSANVQSLLGAADYSAARTSLGVGTTNSPTFAGLTLQKTGAGEGMFLFSTTGEISYIREGAAGGLIVSLPSNDTPEQITYPTNVTGTVITTGNLSAISATGTITSGTWSGSFGAISGANLTTLNASNLASGTVAIARLGSSGTASASTYLRGDNTWASISGTGTVTSVAVTVPSFLAISGSPVTTSGTLAITLSGTALPIANGGTGATTAPYVTGATSSTLVRSGSGPYTLGLNTGNANTWTATQTINKANSDTTVAPTNNVMVGFSPDGDFEANGTTYSYTVYAYAGGYYEAAGSGGSAGDPSDAQFYNIDVSWDDVSAEGYIIYDSVNDQYIDVGNTVSYQINGSTGWTGGPPALTPVGELTLGTPLLVQGDKDLAATSMTLLEFGADPDPNFAGLPFRLWWDHVNQRLQFDDGAGTLRNIYASFSGSGGGLTSLNANSISSGTLSVARGGTGLATYTQGDILYASAGAAIAKLAKNTSSTRYLSNTGTSNNPAWAQIALATGVSGTLGATNGGTGIATTTAYSPIFSGTTATGTWKADTGPGIAGHVLTSNGAGAYPTWQAAGGGLTIGTTAITSGTATRLLYETAGNVVGEISGATSDGTVVTLTSPKLITALNDANGNELLNVTATASAVNELTLANAATGGYPTLEASGETNVSLAIKNKGNGAIRLGRSANPILVGLDSSSTVDGLIVYNGNSNGVAISYNKGGISAGSGARMGWTGGDPYNGATEVAITRIDSTTLGIGTGAVGSFAGGLKLTNLIVVTSTPASASATGVAGTITWDADWIYICVATNTWKRVAIATW